MSVFRRYSQATGAIHDLEHIAELSADRTIPLLLSPRVLYVLQNLAGQDVGLECRWAVSREAGGYQRLTTDDAEYATFIDVVSEVGYQLSERAAGMGTLLNYREGLLVSTSTDNASSGTNTLTIQGPGDDEVWVIEHISAKNANHPLTDLRVYVSNGSSNLPIDIAGAWGANVWRIVNGPVHLSNDLALVVDFYGCTAGDDLFVLASGYIMDLVI